MQPEIAITINYTPQRFPPILLRMSPIKRLSVKNKTIIYCQNIKGYVRGYINEKGTY